jgi:AmmeMemoRadiSam system protein B
MEIKPSAFSHSWYPGSARECEQAILGFTRENQGSGSSGPCAGGIVPHAGWVYSGRIACRVIQALVPETGSVDTVVLFGAHMRPSDPGFVLASGGVDTPLGPIEADGELAAALAAEAGLAPMSPTAFPDENTLELQFPFIRYFFPEARLVAAGIPPSDLAQKAGEAVVDAARDLGREIKIVGSTDMTHYGPNFGFSPAGRGKAAVDWVAKENDGPAIDRLTALDVPGIVRQGLDRHSMCCCGAAAAAAAACKKKGAAKGICLDYATSYEISRSDSFVGYCGMVYPL